MRHGRHLSNIFDHRLPRGRMCHVYSFHAWDSGQAAMDAEWQHHLNWIDEHVIGRPKATEKYTQKDLEEMGMIGIYAQL